MYEIIQILTAQLWELHIQSPRAAPGSQAEWGAIGKTLLNSSARRNWQLNRMLSSLSPFIHSSPTPSVHLLWFFLFFFPSLSFFFLRPYHDGNRFKRLTSQNLLCCQNQLILISFGKSFIESTWFDKYIEKKNFS